MRSKQKIMTPNPIPNWIRILLTLSGLSLIAVLFVPMWRIDLDAPQYPEGLRMLIYPNKLGGSVDIINGLNHYIGMKTLHTQDFIEFTLLPYFILFFAFFFVLTAIIRNRKLMYTLFFSFVSFGIIAMVDFWRWEYNYGHNLNPEAAIIVPGMAYQPPLIGYKQLLNFAAFSIPDIGGWIFITAGAILLLVVSVDFVKSRKFRKLNSVAVAATLFLSLSLISCTVSPQPVKLGVDNCQNCKMTISDAKFGAEIISTKGKIFKFDEINCMASSIKEGIIKIKDIKDIYLIDYSSNHQLIIQLNSFLLKSERFKSPMGGNIASFSNRDSLNLYKENFNGEIVTWNQLIY